MKMKRLTSMLLATFLTASLAVATGCNKENSDKNAVQSELFVPVSNSTLPLYGEYTLEKADENLNDIVYVSSDESVLEVKDGELFAKKTGEITLTATWREEKQTQKITVADDGARPVIQAEDLPLVVGSTFKAEPKISFNGVQYEGATFTYASNNACVKVEGSTLTAVASGSAEISVSASYRGVENIASGSFTCTVNVNEGLVPNRARYDLFITDTVNGKAFETAVVLSADAYLGGAAEKNAEIVWTVADPMVAELNDGTLKAKKIGETTLTGVYEKDGKTLKTVAIPVTVSPSILKTEKNFTIDKSESVASFDPFMVYGEDTAIGSMKVDGVSYTLEENGLNSETFKTGEYEVIFYSENGLFGTAANLVVADFVVSTADDLREITDYAKGYIALDRNISDVDKYEPKNMSATFTGTFNGLGHSISGMKLTTSNSGLFGYASSATFKNLSITGATVETGAGIGILCYRSSGTMTVDNVYIEMNYGSNGSSESGGVVGLLYTGMLKIKNSIIVATYPKTINNSGAIAGRSNGCSLVIENSYVITNGTVCGMKVHVNNKNYAQLNSISGVYASAEEFAEKRYEEDSIIDLSGFATFWDLNSSVPKF